MIPRLYHSSSGFFKILALFLFFTNLLFGSLKAQISYNGSFEELDHTGMPRYWFHPLPSYYRVYLDSSKALTGKYSVQVSPKKEATSKTSMVYYQRLKIPKGRISKIKAIYHIRLLDSLGGKFKPYFNAEDCQGKVLEKVIENNWEVSAINPKWNVFSATMVTDNPNCSEVMAGIVFVGKGSFLIDSATFYIDSDYLVDLPSPPLPNYNKESKSYIDQNLIPILSLDDYSDLRDLKFLRKTIGSSSIVALGESTHGTREFSTLRNRVILYLIDSLGFKVVAYENSLSATSRANELLHSTNPDIRGIINYYFFSIYKNFETEALFIELNKRILSGQDLQIAGIDHQDYKFTYKVIKEFFLRNSIQYENFELLDKIIDNRSKTMGLLDSLHTFGVELNSALLNYQKNLSSNRDSLLHIKKLILHFINDISFNQISISDDNIRHPPGSRGAFRDSLMADNLLWLNQYYKGQKIIFIAHAGHTAKQNPNQDLSSISKYLKKASFKNYLSLGFFTAEGEVMGYTSRGKPLVSQLLSPNPTHYEYYLKNASLPNFFLPLNSKAKYPFLEELALRGVGASVNSHYQFQKLNLNKSYDGIFFIRNSNSTNPFTSN